MFLRIILSGIILTSFVLTGCVTRKIVQPAMRVIPEKQEKKEIPVPEIEEGGRGSTEEGVLEREEKIEDRVEDITEEGEFSKLPDNETIDPKGETKEINREEETLSIFNIIQELEDSYKNQDFEKWKSLLTPNYKIKYNDPEFLKREGWNAVDLESFFNILIQTRKEGNVGSLSISRVEFMSPDKAYIYVILGDEEFPEPQHTFIKINNKWYKGLEDEGV